MMTDLLRVVSSSSHEETESRSIKARRFVAALCFPHHKTTLFHLIYLVHFMGACFGLMGKRRFLSSAN